MKRNILEMSPIERYFYYIYLVLFDTGDAIDMKKAEYLIKQMDLPPEWSTLKYRAKSKAKRCPDRKEEIKRMDLARYVVGYKVKPSAAEKMAFYESFDPLRREVVYEYAGISKILDNRRDMHAYIH